MPKIEDTVWNPPKYRTGRRPSESGKLLCSLQPGETKRIVHEDLSCIKGKKCSLMKGIAGLRAKGWELDTYHEDVHVVVVRRTK